MPSRLRYSVVTVTLAASLAVPLYGHQDPPSSHPDAKEIAEFQRRVKEYAALHMKLERTLAPIPNDPTPDQITQHQRGLERLLLRSRVGAKQGDFFTEPIRAYFRRQIARVLEGPDGNGVRSSILDEDTRAVRLRVNSRYPANVPRSNVPPQILLVLPRLPEELEYRFVGERLVLLDVHSYTVVDYIDRALSR
jgi:hypothetical protein